MSTSLHRIVVFLAELFQFVVDCEFIKEKKYILFIIIVWQWSTLFDMLNHRDLTC